MRKIYLPDRVVEKRANTISKALPKVKGEPQILKFYVGNGNNCHLVRRVISTRTQWQEVYDPQYPFLNFKWQQSDRGFKYENTDSRLYKHVLNHFEFHPQLADKEHLFKNVVEYCSTHKLNAFDILPITFVLNTTEANYQADQAAFLAFYHQNKPKITDQLISLQKAKIILQEKSTQNHKSVLQPKLSIKYKISSESIIRGAEDPRQQIKSLKQNKQTDSLNIKRKARVLPYYDRRRSPNYTKIEVPQCFLEVKSDYLWILKPTFYNRGAGIHVFNRLKDLSDLMNKYITGHTRDSQSPQNKLQKSFGLKTKREVQSTAFVVQKYLQQPLLVGKRKFDIRIWVLFAQDMKVYMFKQGYVRTSSYQYSLQASNLQDINIHLTNNDVQKKNKDYGKYQSGNQLSFRSLRNLIQKEGKQYEKVIQAIRQIIIITALSVKKKINKSQRQSCFQIFGYDFMLDKNCKPYLIEVNTNPCIEEASPLLQQLLPRMLDDAFCLTIDQLFMTPKNNYHYVVQNQINGQNLWRFLVDLKKP